MVASAGIDFEHLVLDGENPYWREQRPEENGRGVIVSHRGTAAEDRDLRGVPAYVILWTRGVTGESRR